MVRPSAGQLRIHRAFLWAADRTASSSRHVRLLSPRASTNDVFVDASAVNTTHQIEARFDRHQRRARQNDGSRIRHGLGLEPQETRFRLGAATNGHDRTARSGDRSGQFSFDSVCHLLILVTRPEATVWPPSRTAKRRPSSMAIGFCNTTEMSVLSPGITISVPSGSETVPVTSVVRK